MATHSSILAWETPWTEASGRLQSMGSQRVRHNLATTQYALGEEGYIQNPRSSEPLEENT